MDDEKGPRCLVSHPGHPPHNLSVRYNQHLRLGCFTCGGKNTVWSQDCIQYYCTICDVEFHNGCHSRPRRITHPYHLQHPLTLFYRNLETGVISNIIPDFAPCESDQESNTSDQGKMSVFVDIIPSKSDMIFDKCTWCGKDFKGDSFFYRCLICSFCLDLSCAETVPPLTIGNPKSHQHSLLFVPRPLLAPCDACGLVDALEPSYACFQCNYMVHQHCIDLPRVIKITRHLHRLAHTLCTSPMTSSCRVCYKNVDIRYGQYSCNREDCSYVAHSKCATHENVWDGRELEWETEEPDETEDLAPFRKVGNGLIEHFCHKHHLRLQEYNGVREIEKQCQACVLPIGSHHFYHCETCDFSLHKICACIPRKLDHALHNHSLFLDSSPLDVHTSMYCSACLRGSTGFKYKCSEKKCQDKNFMLDVRCTLVRECFTHKSHGHPLFISTFYSKNNEICCKGCKKSCRNSYLQCTVCEFALCYPCATIPSEIDYKYDKHPLTLSYGESADGMYWCEVCEKQLDPREWFYTCDKCCITIHLQCIFGSSTFMKPGSKFRHNYGTVKVLHNNSSTRPFCYKCDSRCIGTIYYEGYKRYRKVLGKNGYTHEMILCSLNCLWREMYWY